VIGETQAHFYLRKAMTVAEKPNKFSREYKMVLISSHSPLGMRYQYGRPQNDQLKPNPHPHNKDYVVCYLKEKVKNLLFSAPDFDRSPISSAYLSGRRRESDANNFLGAVSKLFIL